jgi:RHS repeat-associated protein
VHAGQQFSGQHPDGFDSSYHGDLGGYSYNAFGQSIAEGVPGQVVAPAGQDKQPFKWQGKREISANLYDSRARIWSADLGAFLQPDRYTFLTSRGTLWSWPGQNPFRWRDPSGREPAEQLVQEGLDWLSNFVAANDNAIAATGGTAATGAAADVGGGAVATIAAVPALIGAGIGAIGWGTYEVLKEIDDFQHPIVQHADPGPAVDLVPPQVDPTDDEPSEVDQPTDAREPWIPNKPGRKKQGREPDEKKKKDPRRFKPRNPPREPPRHTPSRKNCK